MKLDILLKNIDYTKNFDSNPEIENLTCNSKEVTENSLFACLKGVNVDGHNFAKDALKSGASAILVEKDLNLPNQILVKNSHLTFAKICSNFFDNPAEKLKFIGVTGTNGKTSITKIIKNLLQNQNKKVGLIGTIQNEINEDIIKTDKTTPDHFEFQKLIHIMAEKHCDFVVMEVSSHALDQYRTGDTEFEVGVFSNLSQDHLDYHKTMEDYFNAKKKLFTHCKRSLICIDSPEGSSLALELKSKNKDVTTFSSLYTDADYYAKDIKLQSNCVSYKLIGPNLEEDIQFSTPGMFSVQNSMAALVCCYMLNLDNSKLFNYIKLCNPIKGRSEIIEINQPFTVICDYAHTPDGLQNILSSIKSYCKGKIITLFGCGGDRDKKKRPIMGEIAAKNSDFVIITSDNPRTENPDTIVQEIAYGIKNISTPFVKIVDRKQAIEYALKLAKPNDVILLAGKGHEPYQIVGTTKLSFNEPEIVKLIANKLFQP